MTEVEHELNHLRRQLFGPNVLVPRAYIEALQGLTAGAQARVGVRRSETERVAYWLDGGVIGALSSIGTSDGDAEIEGGLVRLADVAVKIAVSVNYDDFSRVSEIGRVLTIESSKGDQIVIDASPRTATPERLGAIEQFIGAVLAAYSVA